jgi:beta-ribofuranosylaminobenzene 5'-phosphate synthase
MTSTYFGELHLQVQVKTPSRLHFGLIDLDGKLGRVFGSIGIAVNYPNVILTMSQSKKLVVHGDGSTICKQFITRLRKKYGIDENVSVNLKNNIPTHVGLGSITQISLAVAISFVKIFHIKASINDLALVMSRGSVSGIGTAIFQHGGFIIDGGKKIEKRKYTIKPNIPPILFHHDFPDDWMFVVNIPNIERGFTDEEEANAFKRLPPMHPNDSGRICRLIIMKLLPSLLEYDIENFGDALTRIQNIVGKNFSPIQGGTYSSIEVEKSIEAMTKLGAYGVGQSSWGPTSYGLVKGKKQAKSLQYSLQSLIDERVGGQVFIVNADNKGAQIRVRK